MYYRLLIKKASDVQLIIKCLLMPKDRVMSHQDSQNFHNIIDSTLLQYNSYPFGAVGWYPIQGVRVLSHFNQVLADQKATRLFGVLV